MRILVLFVFIFFLKFAFGARFRRAFDRDIRIYYDSHHASVIYTSTDALSPYIIDIRNFGSVRHDNHWGHCFQDHPCYNLTHGLTHGHMLDAQFGGPKQCFNCMPQDMEQQIIHSRELSECQALSYSMRIYVASSILNNASRPYSFTYICYNSAAIDLFSTYPSLLSLFSTITTCVSWLSFSGGVPWVRRGLGGC